MIYNGPKTMVIVDPSIPNLTMVVRTTAGKTQVHIKRADG